MVPARPKALDWKLNAEVISLAKERFSLTAPEIASIQQSEFQIGKHYKSNQEHLKKIFFDFYSDHPQSKADLANELGITLPAFYHLEDTLIKQKFLPPRRHKEAWAISAAAVEIAKRQFQITDQEWAEMRARVEKGFTPPPWPPLSPSDTQTLRDIFVQTNTGLLEIVPFITAHHIKRGQFYSLSDRLIRNHLMPPRQGGQEWSLTQEALNLAKEQFHLTEEEITHIRAYRPLVPSNPSPPAKRRRT
jgi:hypothetical protein